MNVDEILSHLYQTENEFRVRDREGYEARVYWFDGDEGIYPVMHYEDEQFSHPMQHELEREWLDTFGPFTMKEDR